MNVPIVAISAGRPPITVQVHFPNCVSQRSRRSAPMCCSVPRWITIVAARPRSAGAKLRRSGMTGPTFGLPGLQAGRSPWPNAWSSIGSRAPVRNRSSIVWSRPCWTMSEPPLSIWQRSIISDRRSRPPSTNSKPICADPDYACAARPPDLVRQEFFGLLLAHFAVRGLMHEAARDANEDPDNLSFVHSLNVIRRKASLAASLSPST